MSQTLITAAPSFVELPDTPFSMAQRMHEHPLFSDDVLRSILRTMPRDQIDVRFPKTVRTEDGSFAPSPLDPTVDPVEAFEALKERPTWINIKFFPNSVDICRDFIDTYLRELQARYFELRDTIFDIKPYIILSSGGGVVHFHADADYILLNQIRGSKTLFTYPSEILSEQQLESLVCTGDHEVIAYKKEYEKSCFAPTELQRGDACFIPLYAPHRVTNGDDVSYSFSLGFNSTRSLRRKSVHMINSKLRKLGVRVHEFGTLPLLDTLKFQLHDRTRHVRRDLRYHAL